MPSEVHLYNEAGILYCKVAAGVCNLKNGLFQSNFTTDLKKLLAIVAEAIKNKSIVNEIFKRATEGRIKAPKNSNLECADGTGCSDCKTKVQIYDMLFGQATSNTSGCPLISKMRFYKNILEEMMKEKKLSSKEEILEHFRPNEKAMNLPIYVRVNVLLITREAAIEHFISKGFKFLPYEDKSVKYNQFLDWAKELGERDFMPDYHLHDSLLVFHHSAVLHNDALVQGRRVLIQDKASCIPAAVLDPDTDMDVIDACAAPGNKTTHLLALLSQKTAPATACTLFAFDRDESRFKSLQAALAPYSAPHSVSEAVTVRPMLQDFTKVDPMDPQFANVGYICLDPSCSGSGIMRQVDRVAERSGGAGRVDPQRLRSLQNFQAMLLSHALSFPSVRRVVYSTCSVTLEENEAVVEEVVTKFGGEFALRPIWGDCWMTRGKKTFKQCLRTNPSYDLCNGFFVACFERVAPAEGDPHRRAGRPKLRGGESFVKLAAPQPTAEEEAAAGKKAWGKRRKTKKTGRKARESAAAKKEKDGAKESEEGAVSTEKKSEGGISTEKSDGKASKKQKKNGGKVKKNEAAEKAQQAIEKAQQADEAMESWMKKESKKEKKRAKKRALVRSTKEEGEKKEEEPSNLGKKKKKTDSGDKTTETAQTANGTKKAPKGATAEGAEHSVPKECKTDKMKSGKRTLVDEGASVEGSRPKKMRKNK